MLTIREASPADQDFIWEMLFWAAHADEDPGADLDSIRANPDLMRYAAAFDGRPGDLGVIGTRGRRDVGAAWVRPFIGDEKSFPSFVAEDVPELAIAVRPELTGRGVGAALLEDLIGRARQRHGGIVLTVRLSNPAVRLYERHGFREIGRIRNRVGTESIKMLLEF